MKSTKHPNSGGASPRRRGFLLAFLLLVGPPLLLRIAALAELQRSLTFRVPLVDALVNHRMASELASGTFRFTEPFWQPPFYGYFLGFVYRIAGPSPVAAKIVQAVLGALSCWLLFRLTDRLLGRRAAWVAWGLAAVNGTLLYFDLQLLNASLLVFLLLLGLERITATPPRPRDAAIGGLALGLASITVATSVLVLAAVAVWLWMRRRLVGPRVLPAFAVPGLLPILVVAIANISVSREPILISYNGGINYWLGNNPDYERTVAIRPGRAWDALIAQTTAAGAISAGATSSFWMRKATAWQKEHPGDWLRLLLHKARLYFRGDEISRNQQIYPYRASSLVLRTLLWVRGLAVPFGTILPLSATGLGFLALDAWRSRGQRRDTSRPAGLGLLASILGLYSIGVIAFFIAARYRLPMVPLFILFAAAGVVKAIEALRARDYRRLLLPAALLLVFGVLGNVGVPPASAVFDSDTYSDLGNTYQEQGKTEEARREYELALKLKPDNMEAANNLGCIFLAEKKLKEAEEMFRLVLTEYPEDTKAILNLGAIYYQRQEPYMAGHCAQVVYNLDPTFPNAAAYLSAAGQMADRLEASRMQTDPEGLLDQLESLFRETPQNDFLFKRLTPLLDQRHDNARALRIVEAKLALAPADPELRRLRSRYQTLVGG